MVILTWVLSGISLPTTIIGLYFLGEKNKLGFVYFTISLLCQLVLFAAQKNIFLSLQMIVLIVFNIRNYLLWKMEECK